MADTRSLIRVLPVRNTRHQSHYQEPDTDSDDAFETPLPAPLRRKASRPSRSTRRIPTYRETSDSDQEDGAISSRSTDVEARQPQGNTLASSNRSGTPALSRPLRKRPRAQTQHQSQSYTLDTFKRRKVGHPRLVNPKGRDTVQTVVVPYSGVIPPWQTLPYELLVKIMKYATYPLCSANGMSNSSRQWLVNTSKLCRSFNDAVTTALLYCPPLLPADHAWFLIKMLKSDPATLTHNYGNRIRVLEIEVQDHLLRKSRIELESLLKCSPLLTELRVFHKYDHMIGKALWANPPHGGKRWPYRDLFLQLDSAAIKLKVFEWNGRFVDTVTQMQTAQHHSCLHELDRLTIISLMFDEKDEDNRLAAREIVTTHLNQLSNLKSLTFRYCNVLDDTAMARLPPNLKTLQIINCPSLTSDGLQAYLVSRGITLTELYLSGNQVMSLGFMPDLEKACPNLEQLHIDLNYDDCTSYNDREPLFDDLLPNGTPTWPTKLQSIIIEPLRSLSDQDAEGFYTSLINAAASLKYLRKLSLKTLLKSAGWRDRAKLRSKWAPLFDQVFLSKKTYIPKPTKTSSSHPPKKSPRKSARLIELGESSVSESADESEINVNGSFLTPLPRQNACNLVEFELSDQRPAKEQYTEQDFMDDELAGDGEYNG